MTLAECLDQLDLAGQMFRVVERQIRPAQADAVNVSIKSSLQRFFNPIQRELDARRAAVDG
jgi:hypothetical protein